MPVTNPAEQTQFRRVLPVVSRTGCAGRRLSFFCQSNSVRHCSSNGQPGPVIIDSPAQIDSFLAVTTWSRFGKKTFTVAREKKGRDFLAITTCRFQRVAHFSRRRLLLQVSVDGPIRLCMGSWEINRIHRSIPCTSIPFLPLYIYIYL